MKHLRIFIYLLALTGLATPCLAQAVHSATAPVGSAMPAATVTAPVGSSRPLLTLAPLPIVPLASQLGQTLQTLVGVGSAAPVATGSSMPTAGSESTEDASGQVSDTFASDIFDTLSQAIATLKADSATFVGNLASLSDLGDWLRRQSSDPRRQALWSEIGNDILVIIGVPLLGAVAVTLLILPLRLRLRGRIPAHVAGRVGLMIGLFILRLLPLLVFVGASLLLLDQNETHNLPRYVVLNIIYAITAGFTIRQLLRSLFAPTVEPLRFISFTTAQAVYSFRWLTAFSLIIVCGYFSFDIADAVKVPPRSIIIFQNAFGLVLTIMAIVVICQTRLRVALILRGPKSDAPPTFLGAFRQWLARHWQSLAIAYLIISLSVTVLGINNGIALMLRGTILTFAILVLARVCFLALERWTMPTAGGGTIMHRLVLAFVLRPLIWVIATLAIASLWGFHIRGFIATPSGQRVTNAFLSVSLTLLILTVIYEFIDSSIERHLSRRDKESKLPTASARARTLLPMVRNTVFIFFCGISILSTLAAVGLNLGPVLAGAGVVGVAIGFGSQSLVKDFLTGLFIVVENSVAVGDVVTIGAFSGVVETLSIRTIRLRDGDGSLHILPFSEVTKITNMTKSFAYAMIDVQVSYDSDLERVMDVLRDIGAGVQNDPLFKRVIEEPLEVLGVESLNDSSVTVRIRMRTRPGKQWDVKRLLLLRIVQRFGAEKIDIPYPTVTHILQNTAAQDTPPSQLPPA